MAENVEFYTFLRKLKKAPVIERISEFRRHVTWVTEIDGEVVSVKTDDIQIYHEKVKAFIKAVNKMIHDDEDDLLSQTN